MQRDIAPTLFFVGDKVLFVDSSDRVHPDRAPIFNTPSEAGLAALRLVIDEIQTAFGIPGLVAISVAVVGLARRSLMSTAGGFPFVMLIGAKATGKTTLMKLIALFFQLSGHILQAGETSKAALNRQTSAVRSFPLLIDDARSDIIEQILHQLLGLFSGSTATRAKQGTQRGTLAYSADANVLLAAESVPTDPALGSRTIPLAMGGLARTAKSASAITKLQTLVGPAGAFLLKRISAMGAEFDKLVLNSWRDAERRLGEIPDGRDRTQVWSVALSAVAILLHLAQSKDRSVIALVQNFAIETAREYADHNWVNEFFADLATIFQTSDRRQILELAYRDDKSRMVWFSPAGLIALWRKWSLRQRRTIFYSDRDLRRDLKVEAWMCVPPKQKKVRIGGRNINVIGIRLDVQVPPPVANFLESVFDISTSEEE
ncbi:MAG: hypothetical protein IPP14_05760 [Planctomycetes bacterium]|nr:hypothetical protein [Planctomycetota bacterium]